MDSVAPTFRSADARLKAASAVGALSRHFVDTTLEDTAKKTFDLLLFADIQTVIDKEIVLTTLQSLLFINEYQQLFLPNDVDQGFR